MTTGILFTSIKPRSPQGEFANEPFVNFKAPENARAMVSALDLVATQLGREYDLIMGGKRLRTSDKILSTNPARPEQLVGMHQKAGAEHAEEAVAAAHKAFEFWSRTSTDERVSLLLNAAEIIRLRKFEFMAWLVYEVGKNWAEADADVGEAIDFLEFYAREALRLAALATPIQYPGEELSVCDYGWDDGGVDRHGKYGDSEAFERCADYCGQVCRGAGRGRHAGQRGELLSRLRRHIRQRNCRGRADALCHLHRIEGRGA
jgi:hypothetical protein